METNKIYQGDCIEVLKTFPDESINCIITSPPYNKHSCRRHISELKPFGKAGDPLNASFEGAMLLKTFRSLCPHDRELDKEIEEIQKMVGKGADGFLNYDEYIAELEKRYGKEKAENITFYDQAVGTVSASWECRDCIVLMDDEYFKVMGEAYEKEKNNQVGLGLNKKQQKGEKENEKEKNNAK